MALIRAQNLETCPLAEAARLFEDDFDHAAADEADLRESMRIAEALLFACLLYTSRCV